MKKTNEQKKIERLEKEKEIDRLKQLLNERKEEYKIFGATSSDYEQDNNIKAQILELQREIQLIDNL